MFAYHAGDTSAVLAPPVPEYTWSRPGRFGRDFHSALHTIHRYPDGQMVWQGTEVCWLGTQGADEDPFTRAIQSRVRMTLRERQPAALRTLGPSSLAVLGSISDGSLTHFEDALGRARAWSVLD